MERDKLSKILKEKFEVEIPNNLNIYQTKEKIYIFEKGVEKILNDLKNKKVNIQMYGIYFGKEKTNNIQLSVEGSQIIGKYAKKGLFEFKSREEFERFLKGEELELPKELENEINYPIAKYKDYFGGSIFIDRKRKKIVTRLSKGRRAILIS